MILLLLIAIPIIGGLAAWTAARWSPTAPRWIALGATAIPLVLALSLWGQGSASGGQWIATFDVPWIPAAGIDFHLAIDGLSLLLVLLTYLLGVLSVAVSWNSNENRPGFFFFNLLLILGGTTGVFIALDLFLFFFFWELMVLPMYFLIGIWGHENRNYAAIKFFLFTQASGLLLLIAILGLHFAHFAETGIHTFRYEDLLGTSFPPSLGMGLMLGFFIAFAVKLPAFPFHTWLADAHTEAPTAGSVILAGLLLKTGGYGLLRFVVPIFPEASAVFAPVAMTLGAIGILYGAKLAFAQSDLKRLVAYTSVSHMGFVLIGVFAWNTWAIQGVIVQMIAHGLSTGALFIIAGGIQDRLHTRDMNRMGGFWPHAPRMAALALFFAMASLGLPGLGNFVGEFLVLIGTFQKSIAVAVFATVGIVGATVYSLWIIQRVFHGEAGEATRIADLSVRETVVLSVLVVGLLGLGLYPRSVLQMSEPVASVLQAGAPSEPGVPGEARSDFRFHTFSPTAVHLQHSPPDVPVSIHAEKPVAAGFSASFSSAESDSTVTSGPQSKTHVPFIFP